MFLFKNILNEKGNPLVMGILNVTPDSFSDGGEAFNESAVVNKVKSLCADGADIIDIGACSTAPDNTIICEQEELNRLKRFLHLVIDNSSVPVSVDTFRPSVAEYAISNGAHIINDESGVFNEAMAQLVKKTGCGWIFMHTGNSSPKTAVNYENGVLNDVLLFFRNMRDKAKSESINEGQLCYDCGIGFGKTREDDITLLSNCDVLSRFSPLLIGASRKRIIGELTGERNTQKRVEGSIAVAKLVSEDGASILRVHDVKETVKALKGD